MSSTNKYVKAAETKNLNTVLIAGITPYFLERGALWFKENQAEILKKARSDPWWRDHLAAIKEGMRLPFSPFLRNLAELGYAKAGRVERPGEFAARGGIVDVFPVNLGHPIRIEFVGNVVGQILPLPAAQPPKPLAVPLPKHPSDYERLWLAGLKPGDYLVHQDHGIGIFKGILSNPSRMTSNSSRMPPDRIRDSFEKSIREGFGREFYLVEYAPPRRGGTPDRLYVPREQSRKLSRYIGFETPTVHRLGGTVWESTKRKAKEEARKFAEELMAIFRGRARATRRPYPLHHEIQGHLASSFPFEETPDQMKALEEIHDDLSRERPMDRLLVGDVGFGKTEVAIRTAARVAYSAKQVALLAPTTILADQHFATFQERLRGLPLRIAMISRLTPKRQMKKEIEKLRNGETDIVIGTHRLLSRDIAFRDLGLVIIDEEQRFGVRHKERFKQLRAELDILSLTATPIPRTLSLALSKFRDLSLIQTPPPGRLPIKTFVLPFSKKLISEAIAAELKRRGQVFYLWNRIENIEMVRRELQELLGKKSSLAVLHGRMAERQLIGTMHAFRSGNIDVLLATTIIENGLDLPSVNTLIVANAMRLGLSQAYQIRGRIGRGDLPAFSYFLYPSRSLTEKGRERLEALKSAEAIGSGFQIALKDLEIRGAGNVLGRQQSGTMNRVGLNLYAQLLGEALEELEENKV